LDAQRLKEDVKYRDFPRGVQTGESSQRAKFGKKKPVAHF
jgi:hypothetical protein